MHEAQDAILSAFDHLETVTSTQLRAATDGFSEKTANRARAALTREGILIRSRRGLEGEVTYTIARGDARFLPATYPPRRSFEDRRSTLTGDGRADGLAFREYDDRDYDRDNENDAAHRSWCFIVAGAVLLCGVAGFVFVRRRLASLSIGSARSWDDMALVSLLAGPGVAPSVRSAAPRAIRAATVAPYPGDDAIFGPGLMVDEEPNPRAGLFAYEAFAAFPGMHGFVPEIDVDG